MIHLLISLLPACAPLHFGSFSTVRLQPCYTASVPGQHLLALCKHIPSSFLFCPSAPIFIPPQTAVLTPPVYFLLKMCIFPPSLEVTRWHMQVMVAIREISSAHKPGYARTSHKESQAWCPTSDSICSFTWVGRGLGGLCTHFQQHRLLLADIQAIGPSQKVEESDSVLHREGVTEMCSVMQESPKPDCNAGAVPSRSRIEFQLSERFLWAVLPDWRTCSQPSLRMSSSWKRNYIILHNTFSKHTNREAF